MPHFSENLTGQRSHFIKQWLQGTRDHSNNSFHVFTEAPLQMTAIFWVSALCSGWMFLTFWRNIPSPLSGWQSWFGHLGGCWSDNEERLLQVIGWFVVIQRKHTWRSHRMDRIFNGESDFKKVLLHLSAVGAVKNMWVVTLVQSLPVVKLDWVWWATGQVTTPNGQVTDFDPQITLSSPSILAQKLGAQTGS